MATADNKEIQAERPGSDSDSLIQTLTGQIQSSSNQQLSILVKDPSAIDLFLQALSTNAHSKARPLALLSLSRLVAESATQSTPSSSIASIFGPFLQTALQESQDESIQSTSRRIAIVSLLNALAALDPNSSIHLLSEPSSAKLQQVSEEQPSQQSFDLLSKLFFSSTSFNHENKEKEVEILGRLFDFCLAELISTLASSASTRKILHQDPLASKVQSFVKSQSVDDRKASSSADAIKHRALLLVSLASLKIKKGSKSTDLPQPQSKSQIGPEKEAEKGLEKSEHENLFNLSRKEILSFREKNSDLESHVSSICSKEFQSEITRTSILASLESFSHLTLLKRSFREKVARDDSLLKSIRAISGIKTRSKVFPSRSESETQSNISTSSYELDSRLSKLSLDGILMDSTDSAIQYGVVSLISNLVTYSHSRPGAENSKERAQMRKLKEMANGKSRTGGTDEEEETEEDPNPIVDQRSSLLIGVGIVQTLVGILVTPDLKGKTSINPSRAIRKELAKALYGLCVKQNRINRGKIIQEGGARGLLSLGSLALAEYNQSFENENFMNQTQEDIELDLTACSALSLLLISHPPQMVLGAQSSINSALPLMTALYLSPNSTDLQRFEAALALTNLSSIDENSATKVSKSKAPRIRKQKGFLDGKDSESDESKFQEMTIGNSLEALILLENNLMLRRANVELLCNLVAGDEDLNKLWSGEKDEENEEKSSVKNPASNSRSRTRIHALVAFSSPDSSRSTNLNEKETHNNVSIPLRLASSGALASLSESPTTCSHLLALGPRTLNHIVRLIDFTVAPDLDGFKMEEQKEEPKIQEIMEEDEAEKVKGQEEKEKIKVGEEDEDLTAEEEIDLHLKELNSWPLGSDHALIQLNLRGLTILASLSSYLSWRTQNQVKSKLSKQGLSLEKEKEIFIRAGFEKAVKNSVTNGLLHLQNKGRIEGKESSKLGNGNEQMKNQIEGMKRQCIKMGMECLKNLKDVGISS